ncbi:fibronectin type III domain-containing protein [Archangium violaceum]|uniref:fibronectin type III domain-containing protein n=1 Tax=Archangium violaceum TaxID=83451 RepID=UPI00194EA23E|nr:Ig-like domain-containing protein [Archangium violaceum]QRN92919.1 fibronectin type III domain-containing protein [Archangium violaceum]
MHRRNIPVVQAPALLTVLLVSLAGTPAAALLGGLDSTPPQLKIIRPASSAVLQGQVALEVESDDGLLGSGVARVEYQVDSTTNTWVALSGSLLSTKYRGVWASSSVLDGSHNLYVRATDNSGNQRLASVLAVVGNPPAAPSGVKLTAPAIPSNGGYLDVSWSANTEADLAGYAVYRSTTAGGPYTKVASTSGTFHRDDPLSIGTPYHYVVVAVDAAGNESPFSAEVSDTPRDTLPPRVYATSPSLGGTDFAEIDWLTDERSTSQVEYGTTSALGSATSVDPNLTLNHHVRLSNLQPGTTYFFKVRSVDVAGNDTVSPVLSFTTQVDYPPTVSIVNLSNGAVLRESIPLQIQAVDQVHLSKVEYTIDGVFWRSTSYNSQTGYYEGLLDTNTLSEGSHMVGARATDHRGQETLALIDVWVERSTEHKVRMAASDRGSGIAAMEWQVHLVPAGAELEVAPEPDPAAWQPLPFDARSGLYETSWLAPVVGVGQRGFLYARATDGAGKSTTSVWEIEVPANGRDFQFTGVRDEEESGTVVIEPIGAEEVSRF